RLVGRVVVVPGRAPAAAADRVSRSPLGDHALGSVAEPKAAEARAGDDRAVQGQCGCDGGGEDVERHQGRVPRMALYDAVRGLELDVESFATERRETAVSSEFTRVTTTVVLSGAGETGQGEDVTYQAEAHDGFPVLRERGTMTVADFSEQLDPYEFEDYRRW